MDSLFAKIILFFASILTILSGPSYIKLGADSLTFDFKTGENFPIYYFLNVQNTGPAKERFEISSDAVWVSVYREGTDFTFVELPSQAYINFVLEIRPERLPDGINEAKINLKVLDIESLASQELVLDSAEVSVTVNKNFEPTAAVSPAPSPEKTVTPELIAPTQTQVPTQAPTFTATPKPQVISPSPKITPAPSPEISPTAVPEKVAPVLKPLEQLIQSLRSLVRFLFRL